MQSPPFDIPEADRQFLLSQKQTRASYHKNIAYKVREDRVTGLARNSGMDRSRLLDIMRRYASNVRDWTFANLSPYAPACRVDYASFRPVEEAGRDLSQRARNDLLHVDAFPTRPTNGDRILRFFTNIHPTKPRVWLTGESFDLIAPKYAADLLSPGDDKPVARSIAAEVLREPVGEYLWRKASSFFGLRSPHRSPYDRFMLKFHDHLKASREFQTESRQFRWEFPPNSCWIVFTDAVPHAALSGQFALEMTFLVPRANLLLPELAPIQVLENLSGRKLSLQT